MEIRDEPADPLNRGEAWSDRPTFAPVPVQETAREAAAGERSRVVDTAPRTRCGDHERGTRLREAFLVVEHTESHSSRGRDFVGAEGDVAEERTVAAEPAGLTQRRQLVTDDVAQKLPPSATEPRPTVACTFTRWIVASETIPKPPRTTAATNVTLVQSRSATARS